MSYRNAESVICINSEGFPASLTVDETYTVMCDDDAAKHGLIRVIDDSGEDYLYPESYFIRAKPTKESEHQSSTTA